MNIGWAGKSGFGGVAVGGGGGFRGSVGVSVGAEGCAKGAAEKRIEMGWDGKSAAGGDFANRQIGFLQHAADFLYLPPPDCRRHAFSPYFAESHFKKAARNMKRGGEALNGQPLGRRRQPLAGMRVYELFGGGDEAGRAGSVARSVALSDALDAARYVVFRLAIGEQFLHALCGEPAEPEEVRLDARQAWPDVLAYILLIVHADDLNLLRDAQLRIVARVDDFARNSVVVGHDATWAGQGGKLRRKGDHGCRPVGRLVLLPLTFGTVEASVPGHAPKCFRPHGRMTDIFAHGVWMDVCKVFNSAPGQQLERLGGNLPVVDAYEYCLTGKPHVYSHVWAFKRNDVRNALETALVGVMWRIQVDAVGIPFKNELIPRLAILHFLQGKEPNVPR